MKMLLSGVIVFAFFLAGPAWSIVDPTPDLMGLYFDTEADVNCIEGAAPFSTNIFYLVYSDPTPESIWAFRAGIEIEGAMLVYSVTSPCDPLIIDGNIQFECGWSIPEPTMQPMVLASFSILYMETTMAPLYLFLGSLEDPYYGFPSVMLPDGTWMDAELAYSDGPNASLNADCVVSVESSTFDSLKAMYR